MRSLLPSAHFLAFLSICVSALSASLQAGGLRVEAPRTILGLGLLRSVAISPSRQLVATVGGGGTTLWSLTTGAQLNHFAHEKDLLYHVAFTADSQRVISVGSIKTTVRSLDHEEPVTILPGTKGGGVALTSSGDKLLIRRRDDAQLWNTSTGELLVQLDHPGIRAIDLHSTGTLAVTVGVDQRARIWELNPLKLRHTLPHDQPLFFASLSPDASRLVTGAQAEIWIWDTQTGTLEDHLTDTRTAILASDNLTAATKAANRNAELWLTRPPSRLFELEGNERPLETVRFSPGETWVVGRGRQVTYLWAPDTGDLRHKIDAHTPRFSPDGSLFTVRQNSGNFELWETQPTGQIRTFIGHTSGRFFADFSPTGNQIAVVDSARLSLYHPDGTLQHTLTEHTERISSTDYLPNGSQLLTSSADGLVILWDTVLGKVLRILESPEPLFFVRFTPDGTRAVVVTEERNAAIWNASFDEVEIDFAEHQDPIAGLDTNINRRTIATGDEGGLVLVKNTQTGETLHSFTVDGAVASTAFTPLGNRLFVGTRLGPSAVFDLDTGSRQLTIETGPAWSASISPDGNRVLIAGASLWDLTSGEKLNEFALDDRNGANADGVTFSTDGRMVAGTGSLFDASAKVWHTDTGTLLYTFDRHEGAATTIEFSPDGRSLLTTASDGRAMIWDINPGPILQIDPRPNHLTLTWDQGVIESAPSPRGPWTPLPTLTSPTEVPTNQQQQFFRATRPSDN